MLLRCSVPGWEANLHTSKGDQRRDVCAWQAPETEKKGVKAEKRLGVIFFFLVITKHSIISAALSGHILVRRTQAKPSKQLENKANIHTVLGNKDKNGQRFPVPTTSCTRTGNMASTTTA